MNNGSQVMTSLSSQGLRKRKMGEKEKRDGAEMPKGEWRGHYGRRAHTGRTTVSGSGIRTGKAATETGTQ